MAVELAALTVCGWYWLRKVVGRQQRDWWVELAALTVCGWYWLRKVVGRQQRDRWVDAHNTLLAWALTVIVRAAGPAPGPSG